MIFLALFALTQWQPQTSGTTASLRGLSAVSGKVAWASGTKGTVLRTTDGGSTWQKLEVPDSAELDFRGIKAFNANSAVLMSAGPGALSRILTTSDGGTHWKLTQTNQEEKGFYDGIAFWNENRGLLVGDAVDGRMTLLLTNDGGASWNKVAKANMPPAMEGEGAYAASNTSLFVRGNGLAWFATGGGAEARVFRSTDWGVTWQFAATPLRKDGAGSGIFSMSFWDDRHGIAVGGKYTSSNEPHGNIAFTSDGGATWTAAPGKGPAGYRSAVLAAAKGGLLFTTGTSGTEISIDKGATWSPSGTANFHALSLGGKTVWAAGNKGAIAALRLN